jgi:hypothetical protein
MENAVCQFDGKSRSSKSDLNLSKVSLNASQTSVGPDGASSVGFFEVFWGVAVFFSLTVTSVFLEGSVFLGSSFSDVKIHHI